MTNASRPCARCRRAAVVARDGTAYCLDCNQLMDWSDVIAVVQDATELPPGSEPLVASTPAPPPSAAAHREPALTGGGGTEPAGSDPFSQRLI